MIVDSPITIDMAAGSDRRIVEHADSRITIPPAVLPAVLFLQPTRIGSANGPNNQSALFTDFVHTAPSTAAQTRLLATLPPGLYELEYSLSQMADFSPALSATSTGVRLTIDYSGTIYPLIQRLLRGGLTTVDYGRMRLLLPVSTTFHHRIEATGVGQNIVSSVTLNAIRVL